MCRIKINTRNSAALPCLLTMLLRELSYETAAQFTEIIFKQQKRAIEIFLDINLRDSYTLAFKEHAFNLYSERSEIYAFE